MNKGNAQECLNKLCYEILGKDYYIESPVGGNQANEIITKEIIKAYKNTEKKNIKTWIRTLITRRS